LILLAALIAHRDGSLRCFSWLPIHDWDERRKAVPNYAAAQMFCCICDYSFNVLYPTPEGVRKLGVVHRPSSHARWIGEYHNPNGHRETQYVPSGIFTKIRAFRWVVRMAEAHDASVLAVQGQRRS
jgi:hypothetical protein